MKKKSERSFSSKLAVRTHKQTQIAVRGPLNWSFESNAVDEVSDRRGVSPLQQASIIAKVRYSQSQG